MKKDKLTLTQRHLPAGANASVPSFLTTLSVWTQSSAKVLTDYL